MPVVSYLILPLSAVFTNSPSRDTEA
jgi:hypothetical protein